MFKRIIAIGTLMLLPLQSAYAIDNASQSCLDDVYAHMATEQRTYRSVLFGQKHSSDLQVGSVRYATNGTSWIKTADNEWRSLSQAPNAGPVSDAAMENSAEQRQRRGIFEIRKAQTSDLIPSISQSLRALQCKLKTVCAAAVASQSDEEESSVTVQADGCEEETLPVFEGCKDPTFSSLAPDSCYQVVAGVMQQEIETLRMVIAYDAAYRSLMQFAGSFDGFLSDFRFPLLQPLWQMIRAVGSLNSIPCFQAQCDE